MSFDFAHGSGILNAQKMKDFRAGVLAIQGSFAEHGEVLRRMGMDFIWVRSRTDLEGMTHLIIPGGESTTMEKLLREYEMWELLKSQTKKGSLKVFGTCAGAILCQKLGMPISIQRNAYGSQQHSFSAELKSKLFSGDRKSVV